MINDFAGISKGEDRIYSFDMDLTGLVTGEYLVCLVLYEVNDLGTYFDLDAIYPAFTFDVMDTANKIAIVWKPSLWGYVKFGDLELLEEHTV